VKWEHVLRGVASVRSSSATREWELDAVSLRRTGRSRVRQFVGTIRGVGGKPFFIGYRRAFT